jgi:hypothetical protein
MGLLGRRPDMVYPIRERYKANSELCNNAW